MTTPFFERLKEYFSRVGEILKGKAELASIFPNAPDIGTSRERVYAEVLRQHLPNSCTVSFGGFLFDMEGNESKQIDLIILNDVSLQFNFHNPDGQGKAFACIDGCIAVVSIKSTLDRDKLIDALDNIASLPNKVPLEGRHNPLLKIKGYEDWPYKIVYATDGVTLDTTIKTLNEYYEAHEDIPYYKRPNIIHVCGKYNIIRVGENSTTSDGSEIEKNTYWGQPDTSDSYALLATVCNIQANLSVSKNLFYNYSELVNKLPLDWITEP